MTPAYFLRDLLVTCHRINREVPCLEIVSSCGVAFLNLALQDKPSFEVLLMYARFRRMSISTDLEGAAISRVANPSYLISINVIKTAGKFLASLVHRPRPGSRTTGNVIRLALCRTNLIGLRSQVPCRIPWLKITLMTFLILAQLALAKGRERNQSSTSPALIPKDIFPSAAQSISSNILHK